MSRSRLVTLIAMEAAATMIRREKGGTMAFWKGIVIGSMAGAVYGVINAQRPGAVTRAKVVEEAEGLLIRATGMDVWTPEKANVEHGLLGVPAEPVTLSQEEMG
jgi:phosphoglycerate dehydrogenase-like enzyme